MYVYCLHIYLHLVCAVFPPLVKKGVKSPWTGIIDDCIAMWGLRIKPVLQKSSKSS